MFNLRFTSILIGMRQGCTGFSSFRPFRPKKRSEARQKLSELLSGAVCKSKQPARAPKNKNKLSGRSRNEDPKKALKINIPSYNKYVLKLSVIFGIATHQNLNPPDMKKLFILLATALLSMGHLSAQTTDHDHYVDEGVKLYDKGDYKGAIEQYKKAIDLDKKSPIANYEIASTYFALKDYDKAIEHSDRVISAGKKYVDQAYIIKGSALDMSGKGKEAIKVYKKAVKEYPENHLLFFNLGLTAYKIQEYKDAEEALQKGLAIKPTHASSHMLIGFLMSDQGKRTKSLLALYNFLLLEPTGSRAESVLKVLNQQLKKGVSKTSGNSINITLPASDDKGDADWQAAEMMISILEATKSIEKNEGKTEEQLFADNTKSLFLTLGELKKDSKGFWWNFYVDFFDDMAKKEQVEAFCYYIIQGKEDKTISAWLSANKDKTDALARWYKGYERK
jgi:tetratricopeptide (TPR) repeat protein